MAIQILSDFVIECDGKAYRHSGSSCISKSADDEFAFLGDANDFACVALPRIFGVGKRLVIYLNPDDRTFGWRATVNKVFDSELQLSGLTWFGDDGN